MIHVLRVWLTVLVLCVLCAVPAQAEDNDYQDLLFFSDARPVLIRVHVRVDGRPYAGAWNRYVAELFQFLDRDGDGVLSRDEASRAPSNQQFQRMRQQGYTYGIGGSATFATFSELDADEDGEVIYEEFTAYYQRGGAAGIQLTLMPSRPTAADALTDMLFQLLGDEKEGKLTAASVPQASKVLRPYDADDNELVSAAELIPPTPQAPVVTGMMATPARVSAEEAAFVLITSDAASDRLTQRLALAKRIQDRYDRDGNGVLDRKELLLDEATFRALDANGDGTLNAVEVLRMLRRPPDLEVLVRLGKTGKDEQPLDLVRRDAPLAQEVRVGNSGTLLLRIGDGQVDLRRAVGSGGEDTQVDAQSEAARERFIMQLKAADTKSKGYLERSDLQKAQFRNFLTLFDLADRDNDGQLTDEELNGWFDVQAKSVGSYIGLTVLDNGRSLFDILDTNRDGSLGPRELRTAWARLLPFDRKSTGKVARTDIPRQFSLVVGLGQASQTMRAPQGASGEPGAVTTRGPLWFRKMDRNGDGDVSLAEFLGSKADFEAIDSDHDGLMSVEEAERFDTARRAKK